MKVCKLLTIKLSAEDIQSAIEHYLVIHLSPLYVNHMRTNKWEMDFENNEAIITIDGELPDKE